ncbi:MAG: acetyltransferase [Gillisia sp.]
MERTKINIIGASGHAKVIIDILKSLKIEIDSIFDDDENIEQVSGYPVIHTREFAKYDAPFVVAIGNNQVRKNLSFKLNAISNPLVHPTAVISQTSPVGAGSVVMPNAVINADTVVGEHCIINTGSLVEHDCILEDWVHISPNATVAGGVKIGEGTHIGIGAAVIPNITIGKWVTIGAGSVVIENIPDNAVVVGNPGRIIKYINKPL